MQDNTGTLTIKGALTRIGRKRYSEDRFDITKFALSDDEINYKLISSNLADENLAVNRNILFDVWTDSASNIRSKLLKSGKKWQEDFNYNFDITTRTTDTRPEYQTVKGKNQLRQVPFPTYQEVNGQKEIIAYLPNKSFASEQASMLIGFTYSSLPFKSENGVNYITATLHDSQYFDIYLSERNLSMANTLGLVSDKSNFWDRAGMSSDTTRLPRTINVASASENVISNLFSSDTRVTKVIAPNDISYNSFVLKYRGNFPYKYVGTSRYETELTLFCENSGKTESIRLVILPINESQNVNGNF